MSDNIENTSTGADAVSEGSNDSLLNTASKETVATEAIEEKVTETSSTGMSMEEFIKTLDENIRENKSWSKFKSPQELAKSYTELEKMVGKKGEIPKDDATPEEWSNFYKKLGLPDDYEGYGIELPKELADGKDRFNTALKLAHEAGIPKKQAEKFFKGMMELETNEINQLQALQTENLKAEQAKLQEHWGLGMEDMIDSVTRLEKSLGVYEAFEAKGLNADADLLIMLGNLANKLGEDPTIKTNMANTPAGIDNEISEVNAEIKEFVKKGQKVPLHLANRRKELFEKKYRD